MTEVSPTVGETFLAEVFDPVNRADPYDLYRRMREQGALLEAGNHLWFTFNHELAHGLLRAKNISSNEHRSTFFQEMVGVDERFQKAAEQQPMMLFLDPPDHTRLRDLVNRAFTARTVERLVPRIEELTTQLLDAIPSDADGVSTFDAVANFAHPLPVAVICELLGIPREDEAVFSGWSDQLTKGIDPGVLRTPEDELAIEQANEELELYLAHILEDRRANPQDDLLSELLAVRDGEDRLSEQELISLVGLLLIAGHETTVNLIGNGLVALMRNPDQLARWKADPSIAKTAVDELLRYDSPVQLGMRVLTEPMELDGQVVAAGEQVLTMLGAANRDPAVFEDPETLDLTRSNAARNLSFGGGIHHCLGMALARLEGQIALSAFIDRFETMELAAEPPIRERLVLRGFQEIQIRATRQ